MALKRLHRELAALQREPVAGLSGVGPADDADVLAWTGVLEGAGVYQGGRFVFAMAFPAEYPFKPPHITFRTPLYHPNVSSKGEVCLAMVKSEAWKPSTRVSEVLQALVDLVQHPDPDDPLDVDAAEAYVKDPKKFARLAKEATKKHAMG